MPSQAGAGPEELQTMKIPTAVISKRVRTAVQGLKTSKITTAEMKISVKTVDKIAVMRLYKYKPD
jgi:hypothetical protein